MTKRYLIAAVRALFAVTLLAAFVWVAGAVDAASSLPSKISVILSNDTVGTLEPCG